VVRTLKWVDQAQALFEIALPADFVDPHRPDLASVKAGAQVIGTLMTRAARTGDPLPILNDKRTIRVWFIATHDHVIGFAIEARYERRRTFEDPRRRYRAFMPPDHAEDH
jgi:hypothetical protein